MLHLNSQQENYSFAGLWYSKSEMSRGAGKETVAAQTCLASYGIKLNSQAFRFW